MTSGWPICVNMYMGSKEIFIALCLSIHLEHEDMVLFCQRLRITNSLVLQLTLLCLVIIKIGLRKTRLMKER